MKQEIKFLACEHLDFSDNYAAKKEPIATSEGTKLCWNRPVPDESYPALVQFCKKRGRMNYPTACLCERNQGCSDYKDFEHITTFDSE